MKALLTTKDPRYNLRVQQLRGEGFDKSYLDEQDEIKVACSQCEALVICGVPLHEDGCSNYRPPQLEGLFDA